MITISKEFSFSSAHQLKGLADSHPCSRLHGHNYILRVFLRAEDTNAQGFVQDYRELEPIKKWVEDALDHRNLNDVFNCNTTVENMARSIFNKFCSQFPLLVAVEMQETPKTCCRYEL